MLLPVARPSMGRVSWPLPVPSCGSSDSRRGCQFDAAGDEGNVQSVVTIVTDNGGPFRSCPARGAQRHLPRAAPRPHSSARLGPEAVTRGLALGAVGTLYGVGAIGISAAAPGSAAAAGWAQDMAAVGFVVGGAGLTVDTAGALVCK